MKKILVFAFVLASVLLFSGCPYESDYPLDVPRMAVPEALLGKWTEVDGMATYRISLSTPNIMQLEVNDPMQNAMQQLRQNMDSMLTSISDSLALLGGTEGDSTKVRYEFNLEGSSATNQSAKRYSAHLTQLKRLLFLNVENPDNGKWFLYRLDMKGSTITAYPVANREGGQFDSLKAWQKHVRRHMNDLDFYDDPLRLSHKGGGH